MQRSGGLAVFSVAFAWLLYSCYAVAPKYDKDLLNRRLAITIEPCKDLTDESCALDWIDKFGELADYFNNIMNRFSYSYSNRLDKQVGDEMLLLSDGVQKFVLRHTAIARRHPWQKFSNYSLRRRFQVMTLDSTLQDDSDRQELSRLQQALMTAYSKASSCFEGAHGKCLPSGELPVMDAMADPDVDYDTKQAIWQGWHEAAAEALSANFTRYTQLANKASRALGFADAGEADWLSDFETPAFNSDVLSWLDEVSDLYKQLHAYVRHRLAQRYPGKFDPEGCLPAHILGRDPWGQQWNLPQLEDYPYPQQAQSSEDYSQLISKRFGSFEKLVHAAEEFYTSLGMSKMTPAFWEKSDFLKPTEPNVTKDCHASAWEFSSRTDFRIKMCGRVNRGDFNTIHHEMGHVEYFMAYSHLPREFRAGANTGFHEAVGDTISLSVDHRAHYATLGLVRSPTESKENELNSLFSMALDKVAFLPFALSTGVFRWYVFNGTANATNYNQVWWSLRSQYGGVCPPVDRPRGGFDAGAKYHIALDISYIRYFFSFILQFQLHSRMCQLSGYKGPMNRCDFYRSKKAGAKFWKMLKTGCSVPWQKTLKKFTGDDGLRTSAILEYFKPLHDWLTEYNNKNNITVGWDEPDDPVKGVSL